MKKYIKILSIALVAMLALANCQKKTSMKDTMACCDVSATGTVGQAVNFSSSCSMGATDYKWEFGDGDSSMVANCTHIYTAAATYTVKLMVMKGSIMDQTTKSIKIN